MNSQLHIKDYQIHLPPLGEGTFGTVYHATYRGISDRALKIFKPDTVDLPTMARELEKLSSMAEHPGIVTLHDFDLVAETPYYAMSLHADRGEDGSWRARTLENLCGKVDAREAPRLIDQIAAALAYLHRHQVLHCDLKPSNILVTDETPPRIKICDFGQSRGSARQTQDAAGTPLYSSPEQLLDPSDSANGKGFRWDVYSFGVVAYKLITGKLPRLQQLADGDSGSKGEFEESLLDHTVTESSLGDSMAASRTRRVAELVFEEDEVQWPAGAPIDARRKAIITRCLSLDRRERFADMREVRSQIRRGDDERRVTRQRNWTILFASITALAVLATGMAAREAHRARKASLSEQEARKGAEELVRFILGDLRKELPPLGQAELLDHFAKNADTYFKSLPADMQTSQTMRSIAATLHSRADASLSRGEFQAAVDTYDTVLNIYRQLDEGGNSNPRMRYVSTEALVSVGDAISALGESAQALDYYRKALELRGGHEETGTPVGVFLRSSADVHRKVAKLLRNAGEFREAVMSHEAAAGLCLQLKDLEEPIRPASNLARYVEALVDLGDAQVVAGDEDAAAASFELALETARSNRVFADAPQVKDGLADALRSLGELRLRQGDARAALKLFSQEESERSDLFTLERSKPERHVDLARTLGAIGDCYDLEAPKNWGLINNHYSRAIQLLEGLRSISAETGETRQLLADFKARRDFVLELEE